MFHLIQFRTRSRGDNFPLAQKDAAAVSLEVIGRASRPRLFSSISRLTFRLAVFASEAVGAI
jgi:hypothetical protein